MSFTPRRLSFAMSSTLSVLADMALRNWGWAKRNLRSAVVNVLIKYGSASSGFMVVRRGGNNRLVPTLSKRSNEVICPRRKPSRSIGNAPGFRRGRKSLRHATPAFRHDATEFRHATAEVHRGMNEFRDATPAFRRAIKDLGHGTAEVSGGAAEGSP